MPILSTEQRIGTTLVGKYALTRVLGEGGMGVVFAGTHLNLGRPVAVKLLRTDVSQDQHALSRFLTEARTSAALRHPHVVDVFDIEQDADGTVFMVQELLDGHSLGAVLHARQRLPLDEAWFVLRPVMQALIVAHAARIVHRDLKPDNLFLHRQGSVVIPKVLDFGIAKLTEERGHATKTGIVMGTPRYMGPEQAQARDFGPWYDVWSMGVLWFEMLSGVHPLDLDPDMPATSMMVRIITEEPRRLRAVAPEVPRAIADVIDTALQKDRTRRPDMATFERRLAAAFEAAAIAPRPIEVTSSARAVLAPTFVSGDPTEPRASVRASRRRAALAIAVGVAILAALAAVAWRFRQPDPGVIARPLEPTVDVPLAPPSLPATPPSAVVALPLAPAEPLVEATAVEVAPVVGPVAEAAAVPSPEAATRAPTSPAETVVHEARPPTHDAPPAEHSTSRPPPSEDRPTPHEDPAPIELGTNGIPI